MAEGDGKKQPRTAPGKVAIGSIWNHPCPSSPVHIASTRSGAVRMRRVSPVTQAARSHDLLFQQQLLLTIPIAANGIAISAIES
jgi:hypothetical protein